jgi:hypothetical protein
MATKRNLKNSNQNIIRERETGLKMKGTQQKYGWQDNKKADLDRHRQMWEEGIQVTSGGYFKSDARGNTQALQ